MLEIYSKPKGVTLHLHSDMGTTAFIAEYSVHPPSERACDDFVLRSAPQATPRQLTCGAGAALYDPQL